MLKGWYFSSYTILLYIIIDLISAQHHSVYIPNYLQAFDYPNADETPSPFQQNDQFEDRYNDDFDPFQFDFFQTTSTPSIQFLTDTSPTYIDINDDISITNISSTISISNDSIITTTTTIETSSTTLNSTLSTTQQTTSIQNSTYALLSTDTTSLNNATLPLEDIILSSTFNDTLLSIFDNSTEDESYSSEEQIDETTENPFNKNLTLGTFLKNNSDFIIHLLNRTDFLRKNLANQKQFDIHNATPEEAARHLSDRKTMQSLIHLLPPGLWSQLQSNFSTVNFNQSQYMQPSLHDSAILGEAAAQAGLSGSGSYGIPDHRWHQNPTYYRNPPPQIVNNVPLTKPTLTFSTTKPIRPSFSHVFFKLPSTQPPYLTKPRTTTSLRPIHTQNGIRPGSYIPINHLPLPSSPPPVPATGNIQSLLAQIGFTCPSGVSGIRFPDQRLCNMYFTCTQSGLPEPSLCPEGYLFSEISRDCELASRVSCGSRLSAFFDFDNNINGDNKIFVTATTTTTTTPTTTTRKPTTTPTTTTTTTTIATTTTATTTKTTTTTTTTPRTTTSTTTTTRRTTTTTTTTMKPTTTTTTTIKTTTPTSTRRIISSTVFSRSHPHIVNGTLECVLGADGYYEDPLYCNVYHHCLAGIDYIEHCPNQLAWNENKKMCDWTTNVNCTGKTMPVVQGKTSFCTNRQDGRYTSETYCNAFHHCIGGTDHIVRCTGELQWDDSKKECGWASSVRCGAPKKMLPNENKFNSTFCTGKNDGSYPHEEFCNVYHVCESGADNMRQCPHQLFWDNEQQKCEWSNNVRCTGRTLVALSMEASLFCMEKTDGFYIDPFYCNVYHQCMADIDVKLRCPERLVFNETLKRCDWPESTICKGGNILLEGEDNNGFCTDKPNGNFAHEQYCNRYYICQNGKDVVFTCQNNLRYSIEKNECDWAVNVDCKGKPDYMWEGIKENFCKRLPDGNYPDIRFCNIFHQCQAAMDYPKRCPNRLMFNEDTKECDWEDKVDCKGREKLIDTEGLDDEVRPGSNNTRGRSTKFCMLKQNGDYADSYYCNVYHNCHGGFDTIQYCTRGLVWRQEFETKGRCDWSKERAPDGADCHGKALFFVEKLAETDILANLRSEFCISKGAGLFEHQRYCDLYLQCNEQGVGVTMECSPGLVFNEKKKECDYQGDLTDGTKGTLCLTPRSFLRSKPKAEPASILFEGVDATGQFPTRFDCINKDQQNMFADLDWCNIYHVCIGNRDNIFLCPPGTIFNDTKQGCMDRFNGTNCNGTRSYYKPSMKRQKRIDLSLIPRTLPPIRYRSENVQKLPLEKNYNQRIPYEWRKSERSKEFDENAFDWQ